MSTLPDRLRELAAWFREHSYEVPVTAEDDCLAAADSIETVYEFTRELVKQRDEALEAARGGEKE